MLFIPTLWYYYEKIGDADTLKTLWPTARRQIELAQAFFDENDLVHDSDVPGWCFLDRNPALNKQAGTQGVYLYCLHSAKLIAERLDDKDKLGWIAADIVRKKKAAVERLFDPAVGLFVSGEKRQISRASQTRMVLGEAADSEVLNRVAEMPDAVTIVTPYLYHYYVQALINVDQKEKALEVLKKYRGGMLGEGADTFWELYNPENPKESPCGGTIVNSYCHAWSCAPAYFLLKYY